MNIINFAVNNMRRVSFKRKISWLKHAPRKPRLPSGEKIKLRSIKAIKLELWGLISLFIRKRDKFRCITCKLAGNHCGHWRTNGERNMSLGGNELWWDERALNCQCVVCNNYKSGNIAEYDLYLEKKYGFGILQELNRLYRTPKKWTRQEIENKIEHYRFA